ncbi:hypothetical protein HAINFHK1212_1374, partial [Haemophilus influenzae HK1212]
MLLAISTNLIKSEEMPPCLICSQK